MDCTHNTNTQERNENIKPCNQFSNRKVQNDSVYNSSQPETVITNSDTNTENETESSMIDGDLDPRIQVSIDFVNVAIFIPKWNYCKLNFFL